MNLRYFSFAFIAINATCSLIILYTFLSLQSSISVKKQFISSHVISAKFSTSHREEKYIPGLVSKQAWNQIHDTEINGFLNHPLFPYFPISETRIAFSSSHICAGKSTGVRVYGWINPPITGFYKFLLFSKNKAQFMIHVPKLPGLKNLDKDTQNFIQIEVPERKKSHAKSREVFLEGNVRNFFEVYYLQMRGNCSFSLMWKGPAEFTYRIIGRRFLSTINHGTSTAFQNNINLRYQGNYVQQKYDVFRPSVLNCHVNLSYVSKKRLKIYEGVKQKYLKQIWTEIFPRDASSDAVETCDDTKPDGYCEGNFMLPEEEAFRITEMFMIFALDLFDGDCEIVKIIRIERHKDKLSGTSRLFLEMILRQSQRKKNLAIASYFFEKNYGELCYAYKYDWNSEVEINIVITVKNQRPWLKYLLKLIRTISLMTNDEKITVIVADFDADEEDLHQIFLESGLLRYKFISLKQPFVKLKGIQAGLDLVRDSNSIVLLMDLHMEIPFNFFQLVRKHCIKGMMAFNPIVLRLSPGHYSLNPAGFWEILGFGVIAMYKHDWLRIRRLDDIPSKQSWGGEDWQIVDFILMEGIEISRFRVPGFFHFFHTHEHLWDGSSKIDGT